MVLLIVFALGVGSGYLFGSRAMHATNAKASSTQKPTGTMALMEEINPPDGYTVPAGFGDVGVQLVAAGAIDMAKFTTLYQQQNQPLTEDQTNILTKEVAHKIVFTPQTSYFLLNFFWALGLTNQNDILTSGPMMSGGIDKVGGFASTGGWTLGAKPATTLYSSTKILSLTNEQQSRLLEVASAVYRPCCDNPTHFPDCNHGMAMLGLLELMAAQNASMDEMFKTAKYVNAFWYPQQSLEIATALKITSQKDFKQTDAKTVVSYSYSSITGFRSVHQWLSKNGLLLQAPSSGGGCGVG